MNAARMVIAVCTSLAVSRAVAAPPEVKHLYPAGAARGTEVEVAVGGTFSQWPADAWVSDDGVRFEPQKKKGVYLVKVAADAIAGPRWVRFLADDGASTARAFVIGGVAETVEQEPNDEVAKAQAIDDDPKVVNGKLGKQGDVDVFRVKLARNASLIAAVDANAVLGSAIDAVLQIVDERGNVLEQNHDDHGLDPRLTFVAPFDGEYFVRLFGFVSVPDTVIRLSGGEDVVYRLALTTGPYVDGASPLAVPRADESEVELRGTNLGGTPRTSRVPVGDEFATLPQSIDVGDAAGRAVVLPVDVPIALDREPNDHRKPQEVPAPPLVIAGTIDLPGDRDVFAMQLPAKSAWRVRLLSRSLGRPTDPLLLFEQPDGTLVSRLDDSGRGDPEIDSILKAAASGEYRLVIEDVFGEGSERYGYVLELRPLAESFSLSLAAAEFVAVPGKTLDLPVTIERPAGMTGEIKVGVVGGPKGFADVKANSLGKGDTAKKVTLKLPTDEAFSGPVRVVGTLVEKPEVQRFATAIAVSVPGLKLDEIWITVPPKKK